jgi:acyl-CoA thioesterase FadM
LKDHQLEFDTEQNGLSRKLCTIFEIGRVEWLRNKGFRINNGRKWPAAYSFLNIIIKKISRYDDLLTVHIFKSQSSVKIEFDCVYNEQDELLTTAQFILVLCSKTGRPTVLQIIF